MSRIDLVTDCRRCVALCCVATSFETSEDFAFDKAAGTPCPYLGRDCRCRIHDRLLERGQRGCAIYDCHGAGQRATELFGGRDGGPEQHEVFRVLRVVHELIWLLTGAAKLCPQSERLLQHALREQTGALEAVASGGVADLLELRLVEHERTTRALVRRVGAVLGARPAVSANVAR